MSAGEKKRNRDSPLHDVCTDTRPCLTDSDVTDTDTRPCLADSDVTDTDVCTDKRPCLADSDAVSYTHLTLPTNHRV